MDAVELSDRDHPRTPLDVVEHRYLHRRGSLVATIAAQMDCKRLLGGCLASVAIVIAGCGSSSTTLSRAQLAAKVNAACSSYTKSSSAIPQPSNVVSDLGAAAAYLQKLKPLVESEHAAIAALKPPSELRGQFGRFLAASTHQLGLFESALSKARARDPSSLRDLVTAARYKKAVMVPIERTLGFTACQR
jgi:hypothetical protein